MPHYLFRARYSQEGLQGVLKEGAESRIRAVRELFTSVGGSLETAYWAFGDDDFIAIGELPDNAAAAAAATRVSASGVGSVSTTVLLTATEVDDAVGRTVAYRPPGT
jgi:uncharacterized protein with GYD domain